MSTTNGHARRPAARAGTRPDPDPRPKRRPVPMPGESPERATKRFTLQEAAARSAGCKLAAEAIQLGNRLADVLERLVDAHGPGTGSPLAVYVREYRDGMWQDVAALRYSLGLGIGFLESNLPAPSGRGD